MSHTAKRHPLIRGGVGIAAMSMLVLTGCATGTDSAEFAGGGQTAPANEATPMPTEAAGAGLTVDPGFVYDGISKDVTVVGTLRPERAKVITPGGTLAINEVQEVTAVAPDEIDLPVETSDDGDPLDYGAADGEALRVVDVTYTPHDDTSGNDGPVTDLSVVVGGTQEHLATLDDPQDRRILISAADDGSTRLVVSSEGHDQYVDVLTGERATDEVAAAYYLPTTRQEPHHTFEIDGHTFPTKSHSGPNDDASTDYAFQVDSATLTAWTEDGGWAAPDEAWLEVEWNYEVIAELPLMHAIIESLDVALSVDVAGEVTKDKVHAEDVSRDADGSVTTVVPVPIDTTEATLSIGGTIEVGMFSGSGLEMAGETTAKISSGELTVSFPAA